MTAVNPRPAPFLTPESASLKRWSVQAYHRMSAIGILDPDERTELLAGYITRMAPKGTPQVTSLHLLANLLRTEVGEAALIRTQDPIQLDDFSEPEPDLAMVRGTILDYAEQHPRPEQIYLIVEVADSTLKQDCEVKDKLYAQAGIADYWVVDVPNRQLHIFREPTPTDYARHLILAEPSQATPLAFPDVVLALTAMLPPAA